ncbi:MAG: HEAT repeat domain-containing protein, partial [Cyanobacteria bacterium J06600_6]
MTYIKPEKTPDQSSLVGEILEQGFKAGQEQDWQAVSQQLEQLPITRISGGKKKFLLNPPDWQTAFELALNMLMLADFQHQWAIAKIFPRFGSKIIIPLSVLLRDEQVEVEVRWFICQILGSFPQESVVLTLVQLLQSTTENELIAIAGKTLINIGDRAIDSLIDLLSQPEYSLLAVKSLSYIRTAATIDPLLSVAAHQEAEIRAVAINALGSFHDPRIPPVLINALQDRASRVRKEATIALGFRADICQEFQLVKHLQPLLRDLNLEVCHEAAIALGRMQQEAANTALFEVLQADTTPISLKADLIKALSWSKL